MKKLRSYIIFLLIALLSACMPAKQITRPNSPEIEFRKSPVPPIKPDPVVSSLEDVVNTPPVINKFVKAHNMITRDSTIGVMDFKSSSVSGSGNLVSDTFSINFFRRGLRVVERQNIKKIVEEQKMAVSGMQNLTEAEIAQRIGKLTRADFIIFGAVTQYDFENKDLPIPYKINDEEFKKYTSELDNYKHNITALQESQSQFDEQYYEFLEKDFFYQMYLNDGNWRLHYKTEMQQGCMGPMPVSTWTGYNSARSINFSYPYFTSRKVCPLIGVKQKELDYRAKNLQQDIEAWEVSFKRFLEKYDKGVTREEYYNAYSSYNNYANKGIEDEYIRKVKRLCKDMVTKLREYHDLQDQLKACGMNSVPEKKIDFELPPPEKRFVSIANIGTTFKIIDVQTGEIIWIGQSSKRDLNIQKGLNELIGAVVEEILSPS
jgi:PBP1b-binding outer membrane lipoprotein LpoB